MLSQGFNKNKFRISMITVELLYHGMYKRLCFSLLVLHSSYLCCLFTDSKLLSDLS
jgi:hypothetical protein